MVPTYAILQGANSLQYTCEKHASFKSFITICYFDMHIVACLQVPMVNKEFFVLKHHCRVPVALWPKISKISRNRQLERERVARVTII